MTDKDQIISADVRETVLAEISATLTRLLELLVEGKALNISIEKMEAVAEPVLQRLEEVFGDE